MSANNFQENYAFGVEKYRHLLAVLYKHYCYEGRYVFVDQSAFSRRIQRELKTDTLIQKDAEVSNGVEEKIASWPAYKQRPHTAFFLETRSCTNKGHESDGWMVTCQADLLLYAFEIKDLGLVAYLMDFPQLQQWFWKTYLPHLPPAMEKRWIMRDENRTEGVLVAIATVICHIPTECFLLTFEGTYQKLKRDIDIQRLREMYLHQKAQAKQAATSSSP
ncbi:MAG: hypothetical protein ACRDHZ_13615 [Ktedonobacteraceae bacterium]